MYGKCLMIQGTASSVGKSVLCSALLRILKQDGWKAAPFKAQNMSLNSFVTKKGLEMGRAQVTQAQAAGMEPDARMNPVLLKPTSDRRSQVIVEGKAIGTMTAMEYHEYKPALRRLIKEIYDSLEAENDYVIIEGAGSPAEINLREGDIVNMSMAEAADAPVILVGDIDLGGVFASLLGTVMLLTEEERKRVRGIIINKFRGDVKILEPGLRMLEDRIHVPVIGVVPWMNVELEDEDSVTERFRRQSGEGDIDVAVVKLRHISNFTDFQSLALQPGCRLRYAESAADLEKADLVVLPGTKNTIEDLIDMRNRGMDQAIIRHARRGGMVFGICGGYQMLGSRLRDVIFEKEKQTTQAVGTVECASGWLEKYNGTSMDGYEIHAGQNILGKGAHPWLRTAEGTDGIMNAGGNVLGSYLHGVFDDGKFFAAMAARIREARGETDKESIPVSFEEFREKEFDRIAAIVRSSVDMEKVYAIMRGEDRE